ncbi:MAG: hypothetical protein GY854_27770 [Deltaproteobacteria bacterium]|nr:hypothetical protein [Deltaproteobacteria bacterium]
MKTETCRVLLFIVLMIGACLGVAGCGDDDWGTRVDAGEDCPLGSEGCPCTSGGGCDPGLTCLSDTCVAAGGDTDGDTDTDTDGDSDGDSDSDSDSDADTEGDDYMGSCDGASPPYDRFCKEYYSNKANSFEDTCEYAGYKWSDTDKCQANGLYGSCTIENAYMGTQIEFYYDLSSELQSQIEGACAGKGGT